MGFFRKTTDVKIEELEDQIMELQADMRMGSRKIQQEQKKASELLKRAITADTHERKNLANEAKNHYTTSRAYQKKLNFQTVIYSIALEAKTQLEIKDLDADGALKAVRKVMGAKNLKELEKELTDLNKQGEKQGLRLSGLAERIEDMQESYAGPELNDKALMGIIEEMAAMPPEQADQILAQRLKAGESSGA